jgi:hypothetical protein
MCGDDVRDDKLIAQELSGIGQIRMNIEYLHKRCQLEKSFELEVGDEKVIKYRCKGAYPQKISFDDNFKLTNSAKSSLGKPLGLLVANDLAGEWETKELKMHQVMIKGPASSRVSAEIDLLINEDDYWVYDSRDGSVMFYKKGKRIGLEPNY